MLCKRSKLPQIQQESLYDCCHCHGNEYEKCYKFIVDEKNKLTCWHRMYTICEAIVSIIITVNTNINNIPVVIRQNVWSLYINEIDCCVNNLYFT